jgi:hypothetical protein
MPTSSQAPYEITTVNYVLEWPNLQHPSNTTFAGPTKIDICHCSRPDLLQHKNSRDLGHLFTRYRCPSPDVHFSSAHDKLWVLQTPMGQINLLRPATSEEVRRRKELDNTDPSVYASKNILLLTGPCSRGRYQAHATLQFLQSIGPSAREHIECLSLLVQPYEEGCTDDETRQAYAGFARYILNELPGFTTLCLNVWTRSEQLRTAARELGLVLWKEGVSIVVRWDWDETSEETEEFGDVESFLEAMETGGPIYEPESEVADEEVVEESGDEEVEEEGNEDEAIMDDAQHYQADLLSASTSSFSWASTSTHLGNEHRNVIREMLSEAEGSEHVTKNAEDVQDEVLQEVSSVQNEPAPDCEDVTGQISTDHTSDDDWSDMMVSPTSAHDASGSEYGSWQVL